MRDIVENPALFPPDLVSRDLTAKRMAWRARIHLMTFSIRKNTTRGATSFPPPYSWPIVCTLGPRMSSMFLISIFSSSSFSSLSKSPLASFPLNRAQTIFKLFFDIFCIAPVESEARCFPKIFPAFVCSKRGSMIKPSPRRAFDLISEGLSPFSTSEVLNFCSEQTLRSFFVSTVLRGNMPPSRMGDDSLRPLTAVSEFIADSSLIVDAPNVKDVRPRGRVFVFFKSNRRFAWGL
mmetsp:Transcript_14995/g.22687  ORF Transcript_14995/g.22687 Transcript_14995/m.22687 type:complete len:235 (-) Transcript_14995:2955-3659(-)